MGQYYGKACYGLLKEISLKATSPILKHKIKVSEIIFGACCMA
jgi:hypothetical protein